MQETVFWEMLSSFQGCSIREGSHRPWHPSTMIHDPSCMYIMYTQEFVLALKEVNSELVINAAKLSKGGVQAITSKVISGKT